MALLTLGIIFEILIFGCTFVASLMLLSDCFSGRDRSKVNKGFAVLGGVFSSMALGTFIEILIMGPVGSSIIVVVLACAFCILFFAIANVTGLKKRLEDIKERKRR